MAKSCRILVISITLLFLALGMFGFTFGILPSPEISIFRISLWLTRYACLWTGIPTLVTSFVGISTGLGRNYNGTGHSTHVTMGISTGYRYNDCRSGSMLIQFMACCIFTCLCSIVMAIILGITCEGYCFQVWSSRIVNMYVALICDAGVVAVLTLAGSIVACYTACKRHNERVDRPDTIQLVQNPEPDTYEMV